MSKRTRLNGHGKRPREDEDEPDTMSAAERASIRRLNSKPADTARDAGASRRSRLADRASERDGSSGSKRLVDRQSSVNGSHDDRGVDGQFVTGHRPYSGAGRPPGMASAVTSQLKYGIMTAAAQIGYDGKGKDGVVGYLRWLARYEPVCFATLLKRILPATIRVDSSIAVGVLSAVRDQRSSGFDQLTGPTINGHVLRDDD